MHYDEYRDKHRGAVAWIFGSGPTLDAFLAERPFIDERDLIIGLNETPIVLARHNIHCDYTCAADPLDRYAHALPRHIPLFVPELSIEGARAALPLNPTIIVPPGNARGAVVLAVRVLAHMGATQVRLVGFDGGRERAAQPWISPPSLSRNSYDTIRGVLLNWGRLNGTSFTFWQPGGRTIKHPSPYPLEPYLDRHRGALGWIIGKGSSLDAFMDSALPAITDPASYNGTVVAFLNDTVRYMPEITAAIARQYPTGIGIANTYAFANDAIDRWVGSYPSHMTLFQPRRTVDNPTMQAPAPLCPRVVFEDSGGGGAFADFPTAERVRHPLFCGHGTSDSAAQILQIMGCERIIAVGCDGRPGRSRLEWQTKMRDDHEKDYAGVRRDFERTLLMIDMSAEFYGETKILRRAKTHVKPNAVRLTRGTVVDGTPHAAGEELHNLDASEARTLIGCNKAELIHTAEEEPALCP